MKENKKIKQTKEKKKRGNKRVQNIKNEYNKIIEEKLKEKEKELMTI